MREARRTGFAGGVQKLLFERIFLRLVRFAKMGLAGSEMGSQRVNFPRPAQAIDWKGYFGGVSFCLNIVRPS
jgi:hypothetical protein